MDNKSCGVCGDAETKWFSNRSLTVEHKGLARTLSGLAGWECMRCKELTFEPESARRYADAGDGLVLDARQRQSDRSGAAGAVRQTLGVEAGDQICYAVEQDGRVVVTRANEDEDPAVGAFLEFLERDMIAHPENISPLSDAWSARMQSLVGHVKVDLDDPIEGDVDL